MQNTERPVLQIAETAMSWYTTQTAPMMLAPPMVTSTTTQAEKRHVSHSSHAFCDSRCPKIMRLDNATDAPELVRSKTTVIVTVIFLATLTNTIKTLILYQI